ncbi:MAG: ABC transporter permease [Armatimonadetes bacterium]|nr:ABC transporter permease [Armatimonadota bacterium]
MKGALRTLIVFAGLILILAITLALFGLDVGAALSTIWNGAVGSKAGIARSLVRATPLIFTGLGMVVAWRAGMYNIGGEGQYVMGGLASATLALVVRSWAPAIATPALLVGGALGGALFAAFAGWLHVKRGVQVVISTILLNFVAIEFLKFCVRGPLQKSSGGIFQTEALPNTLMLQRFDRQTDFHSGFFLALIVVVIVAIYLYRTKSGFQMRFSGANPDAARASRFEPGKKQILAMAISGGLCGLAGAVDYTGLIGFVGDGFSQDWGFLAIPVALLGNLNPVGAAGAAVYFGGLFAGCEVLQRSEPIGDTIVPLIQGVAVLGVVGMQRWLENRTNQSKGAD